MKTEDREKLAIQASALPALINQSDDPDQRDKAIRIAIRVASELVLDKTAAERHPQDDYNI